MLFTLRLTSRLRHVATRTMPSSPSPPFSAYTSGHVYCHSIRIDVCVSRKPISIRMVPIPCDTRRVCAPQKQAKKMPMPDAMLQHAPRVAAPSRADARGAPYLCAVFPSPPPTAAADADIIIIQMKIPDDVWRTPFQRQRGGMRVAGAACRRMPRTGMRLCSRTSCRTSRHATACRRHADAVPPIETDAQRPPR